MRGNEDYPDSKYGLPLPQLPKDNLALFEADSAADVFGGMGSWNDGLPWTTQEKGLAVEYENLSAELLKNVRLAMLYAVKEW